MSPRTVKMMISLTDEVVGLLREEQERVYYGRIGSQSIIVERALRFYLRQPGHERMSLGDRRKGR